MPENEAVTDARNILFGRLFTLGGSVLFLIGSFIAVALAEKDLFKAENQSQNTR